MPEMLDEIRELAVKINRLSVKLAITGHDDESEILKESYESIKEKLLWKKV